MRRRRKAKSHDRKNQPASRNGSRRTWSANPRVLGILIAICAALGGIALVQRSLVRDPIEHPEVSPPWQGQSPSGEMPPFAPRDPSFRPTETTSQELIGEAVRAAHRLVDRFPDDPASLDVLARLQHYFGNSAEAIDAWKQCLRLDPSFVDAYYGIGSAATNRQQYDQAAECYRRALALDPASPKAPIDLAYALMSQGDLREVVAVLEESIGGGLRSMPAFLLLGQAYHQLKQYEKAKKSFETAVRIAPEYPSAHYGLAMACARLGQKDQAGKHREEFRRLEAEDREGRTRADTTVDDQLSVRQRLAQAYTDAGRAYARRGNGREAEEPWRRAAALDAENTACREELAGFYERSHREQESLFVCRELVEIDPNNADYSLNVGLLSARLGQFAAACSAVERAMELDPRDPRYREAYELINREGMK